MNKIVIKKMECTDSNLEHCLHQKLMLMANAVARILSIKSELRQNTEKVHFIYTLFIKNK